MAHRPNIATTDGGADSLPTTAMSRARRWSVRVIVAIFVIAVAAWGLFSSFVALQNRNVASGIALGQPAPDFALRDQNGHPRSLRDLGGPKGLLLVFVRSADW
jgi:cytochrome oxidase Cu insertion factor (SCO1/SenC/PrrC family)